MKRYLTSIVILGLVACVIAPLTAWQDKTPAGAADDDELGYLCPMHPDFTSETPGKCARCGMNLVVGTLFDMRDDLLEFTTLPALVNPGKKVRLTFKVMHPGTGKVLKDFELVHDKPYHLFVVSQNLEYFQHIHPEQAPSGEWAIDMVLPKPGYYAVLSDFLPKGGSGQFLARPLITAGYTGDLAGNSAHLKPDATDTQTIDGLRAKVRFDPGILQAGSYGHLTFHLVDVATDQPVKDLQPYLGAFGHMLIVSEDLSNYVHSHPVGDTFSPDADVQNLRGGPNVMFEGLMPKPGIYRAWTQFKYHDKVYTFENTFQVYDVGKGNF